MEEFRGGPGFRLHRWLMGLVAAILVWIPLAPVGAQQLPPPLPESGGALYKMACMACHGKNGAGSAPERVGFDTPLPDFTECSFASREGNTDWGSVVAQGGRARAFSDIMPAFGDMLTDAQITKILDHIRTFCTEKDWPRGELNLPRALYTTKAFPEDEAVYTATFNTAGKDKVVNKLIFETRLGPRSQVEIVAPYSWIQEADPGGTGDTDWKSGVGDVAVSGKHVLYASLDTGAIVSLGGELIFPTGDEDKGLGNGTTVFEPYIAYGQILPADFFFQFQGGAGLSFDRDKAENEAFWRLAGGRSFNTGRFGRRWTPMVEVLGSREWVSGADTNWDIVPQFQVTLSRRQHVRLNVGARFPMNNTDHRVTQFGVYVLWDWFDGGLFEGW